ncbi:hypothetical protein [uncultured Pseudomonas sp.]|uniref:hypothetical protein n=1 Tax=uncultured Pseudomonas sp. TaxID=114707 RepID=UPI002600EA70|nr:hypothetical protein [uncultured Pseudomonas sp.]
MPVTSRAGLKHPDIATGIAQQYLRLGKGMGSRMKFVAEHADDLMQVLAPRTLVLELLAAACYLRDPERFVEARSALLEVAPAIARHLRPAPSVILNELALAIISSSSSTSYELAKSVRASAHPDPLFTIANWQCMILAALVDLDLEDAVSLSQEVIEACEQKILTKAETEQALPWARASLLLARGNNDEAFSALRNVTTAHTSWLNRELDKIAKGASSGLSALPFCDLATAALARLIVDFGFDAGATADEDFPFADFKWMHDA